jgi:hypothetical protein
MTLHETIGGKGWTCAVEQRMTRFIAARTRLRLSRPNCKVVMIQRRSGTHPDAVSRRGPTLLRRVEQTRVATDPTPTAQECSAPCSSPIAAAGVACNVPVSVRADPAEGQPARRRSRRPNSPTNRVRCSRTHQQILRTAMKAFTGCVRELAVANAHVQELERQVPELNSRPDRASTELGPACGFGT